MWARMYFDLLGVASLQGYVRRDRTRDILRYLCKELIVTSTSQELQKVFGTMSRCCVLVLLNLIFKTLQNLLNKIYFIKKFNSKLTVTVFKHSILCSFKSVIYLAKPTPCSTLVLYIFELKKMGKKLIFYICI